MYLLGSLIAILITIFFVVGTHEAAHFFAARLFGVKVLRFSIGFGKVLFRKYDKKGTEYVLALIPLGGYVKMLDESEGEVAANEQHLAYNRQPFYKKFLIVLAGPITNLVCALILYWFIFMLGFTTMRPIIGNVMPNSIASASGITANEEIIEVDNHTTPSWTRVLFRVLAHTGDRDKLTLTTRQLTTQTQHTYTLSLTNWHMDALAPDPFASLGIAPYEPTVPLKIGIITADSPASTLLKLNDKIIAINKQAINNWQEFITFIANHPHETIQLTIERNGQQLTVPITLGAKRNFFFQQQGYLGVGHHFQWPKEMLRQIRYQPLPALSAAWEEVTDFSYFNLLLFSKLLTGKLSLQSLGGPITIFESAGTALNSGFLHFIGFLAFLSISIGIINLFPIPGLDGGHLCFQLIEAISGKPIPERVLMLFYRLGFILILFILFQSLINDVLRMI